MDFHILDIMVQNAFKLYCKLKGIRVQLYDFLIGSIEELLSESASQETHLIQVIIFWGDKK